MRQCSKRFLFCITLLALALFDLTLAPSAQAQGGLDPADPMVRITSAKTSLNVTAVMQSVAQDVGAGTGLRPNLVTYYWQTFDAIVLDGKHSTDKPLFVDLYVPCFLSKVQIEEILLTLADSLARHTGIDKKWIFIHTHFPKEDQIYIDGKIMRGCTPPKTGM